MSSQTLQHTAGPWHRNIKPARKYNIVFAGRNTHVAAVQSSQGMSDDEVEANCSLIAAAPELFAKLAEIRKWMDADVCGPWDAKFTQEIDALLSRATGEQP